MPFTLSPPLEERHQVEPRPWPGPYVHILLACSIALNVVLGSLAGYWLYKRGGLSRFTTKDISGISRLDYAMVRRELYREADRASRDTRPIVMFGDSLTGSGLWEEWYGTNVLNRGIGGEDSQEAISRASDIADLQPTQVFIMLGTNDFRRLTPEETGRNMESIIQTIHERSPQSEIFVESVLPASERGRTTWVREVNRALQSAAQNKHARWIDLVPAFTKDDLIVRKYTVDGVHLNAAGYAVWREILAPFVLADQ